MIIKNKSVSFSYITKYLNFCSHKKGQAAMEFLMSYGWAIIIVITMISAISYIGVKNYSVTQLDKCIFEQPFFCKDITVYNNTLIFLLYQSTGDSINSISATFYSQDSSYELLCEDIDIIKNNDGSLFNCPLSLEVNDYIKGDVKINYTKALSGFTHTTTGFISVIVP
jgi:uncharacterized protein (UPF0333 family)